MLFSWLAKRACLVSPMMILVACGGGGSDTTPTATPTTTPGNSAPLALDLVLTDSNGAGVLVGDILEASYRYSDVDGDAEGESERVWLRDDLVIDGQTGNQYQTTAADVGHKVRFQITPVAQTGIASGAAVLSPFMIVATDNLLPIADAGPSINITVGQQAQFDGSGSIDPDGELVEYRWSNNLTGVTPSAVYNQAGSFSVTLTVVDNEGAQATDTVIVNVTDSPNIAPVADAGDDINIVVGSAADFDASRSSDIDGDIVRYEWSNGLSGVAPSLIYNEAQSFVVTLVVTDNNGAKSEDSVMVNVSALPNLAPVANAGADLNVLVNETVQFDASKSIDSDGDIVAYIWDNGLTGVKPSAVYENAGSYLVTLQVEDNDGAVASDSVIVNVTDMPNQAPVADAGEPINLRVGEIAQFDGSGSSDSDGSIVAYTWSNGLTGIIAEQTYPQAGQFEVVLTVEDDDGARGSDTVVVTVSEDPNAPPRADAGSDIVIEQGERATFDASGSSDSNGEITRFEWSNGLHGETSSLVYNSVGTYSVVLTVTDNQGAKSQDTVTVSVTEKTGYRYPDEKAVYFVNSQDWQNPHAFIWNATPALAENEWPGQALENFGGLDLWYIEIGDLTESASIIFSNNGENQTGDLEFSGDQLCYQNGTWTTLDACGVPADDRSALSDRRARVGSQVALTLPETMRAGGDVVRWTSTAWTGELSGASVVTPALMNVDAHIVTASVTGGATHTFFLDVVDVDRVFPERPLLAAPLNFPLAGSTSSGNFEFEPAFVNLTGLFSSPVMVTHDGVNDLIYVVDKAGTVSVFANDRDVAVSEVVQLLDITDEVRDFHEQGLLSIAFHPEFATNRYAYIYYIEGNTDTESDNGVFNDGVLERLTFDSATIPSAVVARDEVLRLTQPGPDHKGGMMQFHPGSGEFFLSIGDGAYGDTAIVATDPDPRTNNSAQDGTNLKGSFIRLRMRDTANVEGKLYDIPDDNPFVGDPNIRDEIWSYGHRNPWRWAFDTVAPFTLWETEVGQSDYEEINIIEKGGNYGWPICEGTVHRGNDGGDPTVARQCDGDLNGPQSGYDHSQGSIAIIGGFVYRGTRLAALNGKFIYGDYVSKKIWSITEGTSANLVTNAFPANMSSFGTDLAGEEVYVSSHGEEFGGPSTIYRMVDREAEAATIPALLSQTGVFADLSTRFPANGVIEYDVNVDAWLDGARTRHFMSLPNGQRAAFDDTAKWQLPVGSVLVKHLDIPVDAGSTVPFETSVLFRQNGGNWAAANYRWNEEGTEATLVTEASETMVMQYLNGEEFISTRSINSGAECGSCHTGTGSVDPLGVDTRQLNKGFEYGGVIANQLETFNTVGWFNEDIGAIENYAAFADPSDDSLDVNARARAYLNTNCAHCHSGNLMNLGFDRALADMDIMNVERASGTYRLRPFDASRSLIHIYQTNDSSRMPRGTRITNPVAETLFNEWISAQDASPAGLRVAVTPAPASIKPGQTVNLAAMIVFDNAFETPSSSAVTWSSSDSDVLAINGSTANISAVAGAEGTTIIEAVSQGFVDDAKVSVSGGPSAPTLFAATALSSSAISLRWRDNANDEMQFLLSRATAAEGDYLAIATLGVDVEAYVDSGLDADTRYFYRLVARSDAGDSSVATANVRTENASAIDDLTIVAGAELSLIAQERRQLVALSKTGDDIAGVTQSVTWSSSDDAVATVSGAGQIIAGDKVGIATISAVFSGRTATIDVSNLGAGHYVYMSKPDNWDAVNAYIWTANNGVDTPRAGEWPGTPMAASFEYGGAWWRFAVLNSWGNSADTVNVIFNCASGDCQTDNLTVNTNGPHWFEDNAWRNSAPIGVGVESGTQIQIGNGEVTLAGSDVNLSGKLFSPGALVNVDANEAGPGTQFLHWEGTGVPYLLDSNSRSTQMLVDNGLSFTLLAVFDSIADEHAVGREFYRDQGCSGCHGDDGLGSPPLVDVIDNYTLESLTVFIAENMPKDNEGACVGICASEIAEMLLAGAYFPPVGTCDADSLDDLVPQNRSFRLMSTYEYNNSIRDLLGLSGSVDVTTGRIPPDIPINGYKTNANTVFTNDYAKGYIVAAEAAADLVDNIFTLAPECDNIECFVRSFGKRAYRRPLVDAEVADLVNLHSQEGDLGVLSSILSSPFMLYRSEAGELLESGYYQLTDYEVASMLSYTFWGTTPDEDLLALADAGGLSNSAQISQQVEKMLSDPRAQDAFERFIRGWLDLDKEIKTNTIDDALKADMTQETLEFVSRTVFGGGTYQELINADYSFMTERLAQHYGLSWPGGDGWQRVDYSGVNGERRGILGHAGILAKQSASEKTHPVKRGLFVRRSLLCQDFPPPPIGAELKPQEDPTLTVRERFELAHLQESCEACHQYIDGIGFGLENYNNLGLYVTTETTDDGQIKPIDSSGYIGSLNSAETFLSESEPVLEYDSMAGLTSLIADSSNSKACYARQWYRYSRGQREASEDSCTIQVFGKQFKDSDEASLLDLMIQFTQTKNYILRK